MTITAFHSQILASPLTASPHVRMGAYPFCTRGPPEEALDPSADTRNWADGLEKTNIIWSGDMSKDAILDRDMGE